VLLPKILRGIDAGQVNPLIGLLKGIVEGLKALQQLIIRLPVEASLPVVRVVG
jgi:hypothetical protein